MARDHVLRCALWYAVALNMLGVVVFGTAAIGRPVLALPLPLAPFYAAQLTLTIGLFGGVYAWLACQRVVNRPLLLVGAIGKIGFFMVFALYWAAGVLPWMSVTHAAPDLVLGSVFVWWLRVAGAR